MKDLENLALLKELRVRYGVHIGEKSLKLLGVYLSGYVHAQLDLIPDFLKSQDLGWFEFERFISDRYNPKKLTLNSFSLIRMQCESDEEAFDMFYELLDEFLAMEKKDDD